MKETIIVTMFFPLGRESWKGFERSDQDYLNFFKQWSMVKNHIVVFTVSKFKDQILNIRDTYDSLKNKTTVVILDNYLNCDSELFRAIKRIMNDKQYKQFRYNKNRPETESPEYNYVMMLKYFCLKEVAKMFPDEILMWHDFGWHFEGYDFDCCFRFDIDDKICLFNALELDNQSIFNIVKWTKNYISGASIICSACQAEEFWGIMRQSMISLTDCGLCDQDQTILLMAYRKKAELFQLHSLKSHRDFFARYSNKENYFHEKKVSSLKLFLHKCKMKIKHRIRKIKYGMRQMYE